ncbi:sarcosine oxidase subunit gamma [Amaricoccus sp.]|uniref:sarcosine oxidase subunit gamma n=1 Tax=Amaricoccus sp. TaxID=1872485 RepID=UPI001B41FF34|nr:sarcosine oxidase subunit gamma [Amaricoccus sp.]MBP7002611.1 sarcosine oxidase subunit gamma [Amaricoccus sp.]
MTATAAGVTITELPPSPRISLRLADPAGQPLPTRIGAREGAALCLGPDEWLLEGDGAAALIAALPQPLSAVEVTDREITYALEGPAVLDLLATGCPRDLAAMPVGSGARTIFDSVQVVVTREAPGRFHLTVWRSFAPHVRALLALAERELAAGL